MGTLFHGGLPEYAQIFRMEAESIDIEAAAESYAALIPQVIDVLLLGVGEDGHIASLFPHSEALDITHRLVVPVVGSAPPFRRLTITPHIIKSAREVFILALGQQKRSIYEEALRHPGDIKAIPARLVLNRTWIFGDSV
jgi:6-phosphogluconolactonase